MRRQVLFVGLICVAFLVNAQEEKTIDLDEVTIQVLFDYKEERTVNLYPSKTKCALDGWLGFDKADVFTSPMGKIRIRKVSLWRMETFSCV